MLVFIIGFCILQPIPKLKTSICERGIPEGLRIPIHLPLLLVTSCRTPMKRLQTPNANITLTQTYIPFARLSVRVLI